MAINETRIFTKTVDGEVKTRTVTSESGAVAARFDGFTEVTGAEAKKATAAAAKPASNS